MSGIVTIEIIAAALTAAKVEGLREARGIMETIWPMSKTTIRVEMIWPIISSPPSVRGRIEP